MAAEVPLLECAVPLILNACEWENGAGRGTWNFCFALAGPRQKFHTVGWRSGAQEKHWTKAALSGQRLWFVCTLRG